MIIHMIDSKIDLDISMKVPPPEFSAQDERMWKKGSHQRNVYRSPSRQTSSLPDLLSHLIE